MANRLYNKQVSPKGYQTGGRVAKMGGGMMMNRPMMNKGGGIKDTIKKGIKKFHEGAKKATIKSLKEGRRDRTTIEPRQGKKTGGMTKAKGAGMGAYSSVKDPKVIKNLLKTPLKAKTKEGRVKKMGGGMMKRPMMKAGGKTLKPVDKEKNPGLAKLPTKVRNKMGFMKKGGKV